MSFIIYFVLLIIMEANLVFVMCVGIMGTLGTILWIKWDYNNPHLKLRYHIEDFKGNLTLYHDEWYKLSLQSEKKAIKRYNTELGISYWKQINLKETIIIILALLSFMCVLLSVYFTIYPMNWG